MADADKYAEWIVKNQAKKGTPEFETVASAYKQARRETTVSTAGGNLTRRFGQIGGAIQGAAEKLGGDIADAAKGGLAIAQEVGERAGGLEPERPVIGPMLRGAGEEVEKFAGSPPAYIGGKATDVAREVGGAGAAAFADPTGKSMGRFLGGGAEVAAPFTKVGGKLLDVARGVSTEERVAKNIAGMQPDTVKRHMKAAKASGLPPSDTAPGLMPKDTDLESITRQQARTNLYRAVETRRAEADPKWKAYRDRGKELEGQHQYFTTTTPGAGLMAKLSEIEVGGPGVATIYTDAEREAAKRLRTALSGLDKSEEAVHPVSLDVVDKELRHLRALQFDAKQEGYSSVVRERYKLLADNLETALKKWVGEDVYPRAHYEAVSRDVNKWDTKLGRALTGEQDVEYLKSDVAENQGKVAARLFSSKETVKEGVSLLGEGQMNVLAKQYVSNQLRNKTSEAAIKWVEANQWIAEFPETTSSTLGYLNQLGIQEGNATSLRGVANLAKRMVKPAARGLGLVGAGYGLGYGGSTLSGYQVK